jgi:hypothetical protein
MGPRAGPNGGAALAFPPSTNASTVSLPIGLSDTSLIYKVSFFKLTNFINIKDIVNVMTTEVKVSKEAFLDLIRVKEEFDSIVESIELMNKKGFMNSYKKAKEQIKNRNFDDWNKL